MHTLNIVIFATETFFMQCPEKLHPLRRATLPTHLGIVSIKDNGHALEGVTFGFGVAEVYNARSDGEPDDVAEVELPVSSWSASLNGPNYVVYLPGDGIECNRIDIV